MIAATDPSLPGFDLVDHPGVLVLSRSEAVPWVRYVLEGGTTLYSAAQRDREAHTIEGRAPLFVVPAKTTRKGKVEVCSRWAIRHFTRGGRVLPLILGDRYLKTGPYRPFHEARASDEARSRGIPTPRVLAAAVYSGVATYQGDLVTEFIPDSSNLVETLFDSRKKGVGGAGERLEAVSAAGSLIRAMAKAALTHRDLHAGNILLQWTGAAPVSHVLDLDLCLIRDKRSSVPSRPMLRRLKRSLRKWERLTGIRLSEREWATLEAAAMG